MRIIVLKTEGPVAGEEVVAAEDTESSFFNKGAFCGILKYCEKNAVMIEAIIEKISIGAKRA